MGGFGFGVDADQVQGSILGLDSEFQRGFGKGDGFQRAICVDIGVPGLVETWRGGSTLRVVVDVHLVWVVQEGNLLFGGGGEADTG